MRLIAIVRLPSPTREVLVRVCQELVDAGLPAVEVTLTTPFCIDAIAALDGRVGAGSVRTGSQARQAQEAGAAFLVTPTVSTAVLAAANVPVVCGALTPTEIDLAWSSGASFVKVFPSPGPAYVRDVLAPLPEVPLIPTGGVTLGQIGDYAAAGAAGIGVGSALVTTDWDELRKRAKAFLREVENAWENELPSH